MLKKVEDTNPAKKKALFQADEAALKRGAMSGCWPLSTTRLNISSCAIAVPTVTLFFKEKNLVLFD